MNANTVSVPRPEVHHLPTVFRRLQSGDIRVPAFQRAFRWSEAQILSLLDSVVRGYPVGSMLLWEVRDRVFKTAQPEELPFPIVAEKYPTYFVLDGLQRLSSLYGVFYYDGDPSKPGLYNVVFDLRNQVFKHFDLAETSEADLPLSALFSVKRLLNEQKRLLGLDDAEILIERTVRLQATFQEYLLPTVTIAHQQVTEVVEIFSRINSTGTRLGPVDFMRALTWSDDFDLNSGIREVQGKTEELGFNFADETVLKLIAVVSGRAPTAEEVLTLRTETSQTLHGLVSRAIDIAVRSIGFLKNRCYVHHADFLPYEGQLLGVAMFFNVAHNDTVAETELARWFWSVSLNEQLRGKPDHYLARQLSSIRGLALGEAKELNLRLSVSEQDFFERRFIKGKALSTAFLCMFAAKGARSLVTGELITSSAYLYSAEVDYLMPIFGVDALSGYFEGKLTSARLFANLVLATPEDMKFINQHGWPETLERLKAQFGEEEFNVILESQFFSGDPTSDLRQPNGSVLKLRASALTGFAKLLCTPA
jgi:hypothetical protein